jgi:hypothetical protein
MRVLIFLALLCAAVPAFAQDLDPRTSAQTVTALQALLALRDAEMKAAKEDFAKREADWAAYSAPLWQATPAK